MGRSNILSFDENGFHVHPTALTLRYTPDLVPCPSCICAPTDPTCSINPVAPVTSVVPFGNTGSTYNGLPILGGETVNTVYPTQGYTNGSGSFNVSGGSVAGPVYRHGGISNVCGSTLTGLISTMASSAGYIINNEGKFGTAARTAAAEYFETSGPSLAETLGFLGVILGALTAPEWITIIAAGAGLTGILFAIRACAQNG